MKAALRCWHQAVIGACTFALAAGLSLVASASAVQAAAIKPGDFDVSFGVAGTTQTEFPNYGAWILDTAVQADGKIVAVGGSRLSAGGFSDFAVARYLANGSLDPTFSGDGMVQIAFGDASAAAYGVAISPVDGKILIVGESGDHDTNAQELALTRLNTDGSIDLTFGGANTGRVKADVGGAFNSYARDVTVQSDGKVVVVGSAFNAQGLPQLTVLRYSTAGVLDNAFSGDGKLLVASPVYGAALTIASDGKIVVAGQDISPAKAQILVARINSNGSMDGNFAVNRTGFAEHINGVSGVVVAPNSSIVVLGTMLSGGYHFALARFLSNGTLDNTFSGDGMTTLQFSGVTSTAGGLALEASGKILAGGSAGSGAGTGLAVARLTTSGAPDLTFATLGKKTFQIAGLVSSSAALSLTPGGTFVLGGTTVNNGVSKFAMAKLYGGSGVPATLPPGAPTMTGAGNFPHRVTFSWQQGTGGAAGTYSFRSLRLRKGQPIDAGWSGWAIAGSNVTSVSLPKGRRGDGYRFEIRAANQTATSATTSATWEAFKAGYTNGCRRVLVTGANYLGNGQAIVSFTRRARRCSFWRLDVPPRHRLSGRPAALATPVLTAGAEHNLRLTSRSARTVVIMRRA